MQFPTVFRVSDGLAFVNAVITQEIFRQLLNADPPAFRINKRIRCDFSQSKFKEFSGFSLIHRLSRFPIGPPVAVVLDPPARAAFSAVNTAVTSSTFFFYSPYLLETRCNYFIPFNRQEDP